jgi:hypothetical protein
LNPYALRRKHLKLVRLPISPPPHWGNFTSISKAEVVRKAQPRRTHRSVSKTSTTVPSALLCSGGIGRNHCQMQGPSNHKPN